MTDGTTRADFYIACLSATALTVATAITAPAYPFPANVAIFTLYATVWWWASGELVEMFVEYEVEPHPDQTITTERQTISND